MKRIALFGKNNIAIEALKLLLDNKFSKIVLISPNNSDDGQDSWQRSLIKFCYNNNLEIRKFVKIKSEDSISYLKELELDFIFSLQYDQIINKEVINTAKYGAINLHLAPLPKYRGVAPIGHALLNGEKKFGVTLHYMDPGVDTGDIIAQNFFDITSIKNARELYELSVEKAINLFKNELDNILNLTNSRLPQDNSLALYYPKGSIDFNQNYVEWNKDTHTLLNWIKAFIFPPFQFPKFKLSGKDYDIINSYPDYNRNNFEKPGTLIFREGNIFKFATHDSYIILKTK